MEGCGKAGAILSGNVIEEIGAKIAEERWVKIREQVSNLS